MRRAPGWFAVLSGTLLLLAAPASADRVADLSRALTTDSSYKVRIQAALVLGKLGDKRALPALIKALKDENATVRGVACAALGRLRDPAALQPLKDAASDKESFVRQSAEKAIAQISGTPPAGAGHARFYVNVGGVANKARSGGAEASKLVRDVLVRELSKTADVTLAWDHGLPSAAALKKRKMTGYYLDGSIVRLSTSPAGSYSEISCDLKMFIATWPAKSMIMFTSGGAAVQTGSTAKAEEAARHDCLEAAAQAIHQNVVTFLKAQQ